MEKQNIKKKINNERWYDDIKITSGLFRIKTAQNHVKHILYKNSIF